MRLGVPFATDNEATPRKKFKPAFSPAQVQGRIIKQPTTGRQLEFLFSNFANEEKVHTAIIGDSIVDNLCVNNCIVYSLSGGVVSEFHALLDTLTSYRNVILLLDGNNLSKFDAAGQEPEEFFKEIQQLFFEIRNLSHKPKAVVCTVLKRLNAKHTNIDRFNAILTNSSLPSFKMHQEVHKKKCFLESDGVHLTLQGRQNLACGMNKVLREKLFMWCLMSLLLNCLDLAIDCFNAVL